MNVHRQCQRETFLKPKRKNGRVFTRNVAAANGALLHVIRNIPRVEPLFTHHSVISLHIQQRVTRPGRPTMLPPNALRCNNFTVQIVLMTPHWRPHASLSGPYQDGKEGGWWCWWGGPAWKIQFQWWESVLSESFPDESQCVCEKERGPA